MTNQRVLPILSAITLAFLGVFVVAHGAAAGPITGGAGNAPYTKLGVYQGVIAVIPDGTGSIMEIGNAGRDIATTGDLYIRPGSTNENSRFYKIGAGQGLYIDQKIQAGSTQGKSNDDTSLAAYASTGAAFYAEQGSGTWAGYFSGKSIFNGDTNIGSNGTSYNLCLNGVCKTAWPGGGTSTVAVKNQGGATLGNFTTLNFTGAGVTAADAGSDQANITIPGAALTVRGSDGSVANVTDLTIANGTNVDSTHISGTSPNATITVNATTQTGGSGGKLQTVLSAPNGNQSNQPIQLDDTQSTFGNVTLAALGKMLKVRDMTGTSDAIYGESAGATTAIYGYSNDFAKGWAGYFHGRVNVEGGLCLSGSCISAWTDTLVGTPATVGNIPIFAVQGGGGLPTKIINSDITVSNGNVGVNSSNTPSSQLSVDEGNPANGQSAVAGYSHQDSASYAIAGYKKYENGASLSYGQGSAVYGQLDAGYGCSTRACAGIYGTDSTPDTAHVGRWAGYFAGNVQISNSTNNAQLCLNGHCFSGPIINVCAVNGGACAGKFGWSDGSGYRVAGSATIYDFTNYELRPN